MFQVAEKELVAFVDALRYILNGLRTDFFPKGVFCKLLQSGEMIFQAIDIKRLAEHAIVPLVQSNAVVVDTAGDVNLSMQFAVPLGLIQLKAISLQKFHLAFVDLIIALWERRSRLHPTIETVGFRLRYYKDSALPHCATPQGGGAGGIRTHARFTALQFSRLPPYYLLGTAPWRTWRESNSQQEVLETSARPSLRPICSV